ncbi:MAG: hypothetical protein Q4P16_06645 [Spirochaetales bacterium]|nr:hypothetical protein [Spirochaetales bacterium]
MHIRFKFIPTFIAAGISLLIGYGFYAANAHESQNYLMLAFSSIEFAIFLIAGFAICYAERGSGNITALSIVFTIVALIVQVLFTFLPFRQSPYIIVNGILVLLFVGITYALANALNE